MMTGGACVVMTMYTRIENHTMSVNNKEDGGVERKHTSCLVSMSSSSWSSAVSAFDAMSTAHISIIENDEAAIHDISSLHVLLLVMIINFWVLLVHSFKTGPHQAPSTRV
jgi:hypothetical protein